MSRLRSQLVQMSGGVELDGPTTYAEFRRAAIRCVADYDGEEIDDGAQDGESTSRPAGEGI